MNIESSQKGPDDLVTLTVTTRNRHVEDVLAAAAGIRPSASARGSAQSPGSANASTSTELVRRAFAESPPNMKGLWRHLAQNPDREVQADELADALQLTRAQMAGVLGAFGRRWANRYSQRDVRWPFEATWSTEAERMTYRMSKEVANLIIELGEEGEKK